VTYPRIIAEISGNHRGDLKNALKLISAAKSAGADAVKFQTYRPERLTLDLDGPGFVIDGGPWHGRKLFDLYKDAATPWDWHPKLFEYAQSVGIECFSSPFDEEAVALLERLGAPAFKIASFELTDLALIKRAAATRKPLILSTGMASDSEIADAINAASRSKHVTLLHCVSAYPAKAAEANLKRMAALRERFRLPVGLSDHTLGIAVPIAAAALGATMIEKHLTLNRADGGPDASFSLEPGEFRLMAEGVREAYEAMQIARPVEPYRALRRSLYAVRNIAQGARISEEDVRSIRPGHGLAPKHLPELLCRTAKVAIARGTPMSFELVV